MFHRLRGRLRREPDCPRLDPDQLAEIAARLAADEDTVEARFGWRSILDDARSHDPGPSKDPGSWA